jgi:hypothetical protein
MHAQEAHWVLVHGDSHVRAHPDGPHIELDVVRILRDAQRRPVREAGQLHTILGCHVVVVRGIVEDASQGVLAIHFLDRDDIGIQQVRVLPETLVVGINSLYRASAIRSIEPFEVPSSHLQDSKGGA